MPSQGSGAIIPYLGPWWTAWMKSSGSHRPGDRALGAAATLGLSIVIMRLVAQALKTAKLEGKESSALWIVQGILRRLFAGNRSDKKTDTERVLQKGSCHCRAVKFELAAPRTLGARHGPGKISYPHTRVKAKNFRFVKGMDHLQMYYVSVPASSGAEYGIEPTVGAHTFCSRCGVHILHAPNPDSNMLDVNVSCVEEAKINLSRLQRADLSSGVPVEDQWGEEDTRDDTNERTSAPAWGNAQEIPDASVQSDVSSKHSGIMSPGTPSTVETVGTDSIVSTMQWHSSLLEHHDSVTSVGSESSEPLSNLLPPLNTSLPRTLESPASVTTPTTTPMMRDQLKYYMRKHLPTPPTLEEMTPVNET